MKLRYSFHIFNYIMWGSLRVCVAVLCCALCRVAALDFEGFWSTNYNETITVCAFDQARSVLLARTHWPNTPFNKDSAAMSGVLVDDGTNTRDKFFYGTGATITGGPYTFTMHISSSGALGSFSFLSKLEKGAWEWTYLRAATSEECDQVTQVRTLSSIALEATA